MLSRRADLAESLVLAPAVAANNVTLNPLRKAQEDRLCPQTPPPVQDQYCWGLIKR